jgi:uncharacterized Zn-binding protein involved in type VI secretion
MLAAARFGDEISHTKQRSGLLKGMLIGALIVGAVALTVVTAGIAAPGAAVVVGAVLTGAAVGGSIGQHVGMENLEPKGAINKAATTVFVNSRATPAARSCVDTALCQDHTLHPIMSGAATVYVEGFPFARVTDIGFCSFKISKGSPNVFVSEPTAACPGYENIIPEVEPWLQNLHLATGLIGSFLLGLGPLGWAGSAMTTGLGFGGSILGSRIGGALFGKWGAIGGGILGGFLGGGLGVGISRGLGRAGISGFNPATMSPRATLGSSTSRNYKETFFEANPGTRGEVVVHHAVEQQVLRRYPGVVSESQMHSLENLRGIPRSINSDIHLSQIRRSWNEFYRNNSNPTQAQILEHATRIDDQFGHLFNPPIR